MILGDTPTHKGVTLYRLRTAVLKDCDLAGHVSIQVAAEHLTGKFCHKYSFYSES